MLHNLYSRAETRKHNQMVIHSFILSFIHSFILSEKFEGLDDQVSIFRRVSLEPEFHNEDQDHGKDELPAGDVQLQVFTQVVAVEVAHRKAQGLEHSQIGEGWFLLVGKRKTDQSYN